MNDYLNINRTLQDRNEDPVYNTMLPGLLVTPKGNGRDNTVYDNRQMIPDGAELDDATRHEIEGQRGAHAVRSATSKAAPYVASLLMGTYSFPYMLSLPGALSTLGGIAGGTIGNQAGRLVDKGLNNKTNWGEGIGSVAGGFIGGGLTVPAYNFAKYPLYREGLYDWIKYRKQPDAASVITKFVNPKNRAYWKSGNILKGQTIKGVNFDLHNGKHIIYNNGDNELWYSLPNDDVYQPYLSWNTDETTSYVLRPHLDRYHTHSAQAFVKALHAAPRGTYLIDSEIIPFGAKLRQANNPYDFFKLIYKPDLNIIKSKGVAPNSWSSYSQLLRTSNKPGYSLRYTNEYMNNFNSNDQETNPFANQIRQALQVGDNSFIDALNQKILTLNSNAKPIQIVNGQVRIQTPALLKK